MAYETAPSIHLGRLGPPLSGHLVQWVRKVFQELRDPYRPERHYMRGPGPKFRAKQASQRGFA